MDNNTRVSRLNAAEALAQLQSSPTLGPASTSVSRAAKQSVKFPEIVSNERLGLDTHPCHIKPPHKKTNMILMYSL